MKQWVRTTFSKLSRWVTTMKVLRTAHRRDGAAHRFVASSEVTQPHSYSSTWPGTPASPQFSPHLSRNTRYLFGGSDNVKSAFKVGIGEYAELQHAAQYKNGMLPSHWPMTKYRGGACSSHERLILMLTASLGFMCKLPQALAVYLGRMKLLVDLGSSYQKIRGIDVRDGPNLVNDQDFSLSILNCS